MNVVIDTNRYGDITRGLPEARHVVKAAQRIYVPFIVLAELRVGFAAGTFARGNEQELTRFIDSPRVELLFPDASTTRLFAELHQYLRERGRPIPLHDLWVAALTVQHNLMLFTRDAHFDHLPQLARV